jgi:hypothetical protein
MQLPKMNPWPQPHSVLIMDNASIHKSDALRLAVEAAGCLLVFLPPYSPDFNPIEESFSCGSCLSSKSLLCLIEAPYSQGISSSKLAGVSEF